MYVNSSHPGQVKPQGGCCYPHHVPMDASAPSLCEHWPTPSPCYGGCVHGNVPAYTPYWPPAPCYHPPQAPYHTCWGNHSGFYPHAPPCYVHQPFPVGYQQHGIESEKDVTGKNRCTKCSPQMSYPKNGTGVVIEEHDEPEIEKGDPGEAVNHVRSTNYPYPIVWIPHENARNQEHAKAPAQIKAPESTNVHKGDPKSWNGSFPLDENTIKHLMQNHDTDKKQNGKTGELPFDISKLKSLLQGQGQTPKSKEPGQLQYPIFWIPSQRKPENVEASEKKERGNEGSDLKSVSSSNHLNNGPVSQRDKGNSEGNVVSDAAEKSLVRNIPVESHKEPRNIPVKLLEDHLPEPAKSIAKTELAEETREDKRSSPPKASRLPPVCLRVDPLPKRQNGKSKSLSPPRRKEQALTSEETKVASPLTSKMVETRTNCEKANKEKKTSEERPKPTGSEKESVETKSDLRGVKCEIVKPCEENEEKPAKKTFTEEEAARLIQSRFRGYDVRRWEPIKKLKEIASVREQMGDVKKRVQVLELSADQHAEGKEVVVLGEMVMSLLLKLDSVQVCERLTNLLCYRISIDRLILVNPSTYSFTLKLLVIAFENFSFLL